MCKFQFAFVLLLVIIAVFGSDAYRQPKARPVRLVQRHRQFSRQEAEPVTPYPTAHELIPEIPFVDGFPADDPNAEEFVPEGSEHIPDEVYGPPEVAVVYTPDEVYGPPELDGNALPGKDFWTFQRLRKAQLLRRKAAALKQAKLAKLTQLSKFAKLVKMVKLSKFGKLAKLQLLKKKFH